MVEARSFVFESSVSNSSESVTGVAQKNEATSSRSEGFPRKLWPGDTLSSNSKSWEIRNSMQLIALLTDFQWIEGDL
jgi:hypothetical protein